MRRMELFLVLNKFFNVGSGGSGCHSNTVVQVFISEFVSVIIFNKFHTGKRNFTQICRAEHCLHFEIKLDQNWVFFFRNKEDKYFQSLKKAILQINHFENQSVPIPMQHCLLENQNAP